MPAPMTYREVLQGEPLDGERFNGEGGVRKEWWWQAGPVDSCCFCCSLRAGVAILATSDLFYEGIYRTFYAAKDVEEMFQGLLAQSKSLYGMTCGGIRAESDNCVQMDHAIQQLTKGMDYFEVRPPLFYVQGFITIISGLAGLYAVCRSNALAAKVYLWTWLPRFFTAMAMEYMSYTKQKEFGLDQHKKTLVVAEIINLVLVVYFVKVLWSYHQRLKCRSGDVSSSPVAGRRIQLPGRHGSIV